MKAEGSETGRKRWAVPGIGEVGVGQRLLQLARASRAVRKHVGGSGSGEDYADHFIELDGSLYQIERIVDHKSGELKKTQQLLEEVFGKEEVDPEEILRHAIRVGARPERGASTALPGHEPVRYVVFNVKDARGQVVSALCGGTLSLRDADGAATRRSLFMVTYLVTRPAAQMGGLALLTYAAALAEAATESARHGRVLAFAAGECTAPSEAFWNKVGWQRVYRATGELLSEVEYIQPVLNFDCATGEPAPGAGEVLEHLMIDGFGAPITGGDVSSIVAAFYRWYHWSAQDFDTKPAFARHSAYMKNLAARFCAQFQGGRECLALTQQQRLQLQREGARIIDQPSAGPSAS